MAKRKTQYVAPIQFEPKVVEQVLLKWLEINNFRYEEKKGLNYYVGGSAFQGNRFFEYYFEENKLVILAYLKSPKRPLPLDNGVVGIFQTKPYSNMINNLIDFVSNISPESIAGTDVDRQIAAVLDKGEFTFRVQADKKDQKSAKIALALSLLDFLIGFLGWTMGVLPMVITYYLAIKGLKSSKKSYGIIALTITTVSLIIFISKLFLI